MSHTVSIEDAQCQLKELIDQLAPGDELVITENSKPIATLTSNSEIHSNDLVRKPGRGKGMITVVSQDDEHLSDFSEYMP